MPKKLLLPRDDHAKKMGMWLFLFTELLLFGGLFITYSVYRSMYPHNFHISSLRLDVRFGALNTIILLISSMTIAMSITAVQKGHKKLALWLIAITILVGFTFLFNKYLEWGTEIHHGIYPTSDFLKSLSYGQILFFGLYYCMTGLHGFHIIVGIIVLSFMFVLVKQDKINPEKYILLENGALYWHLVDLIWIFLFPLLYLIT